MKIVRALKYVENINQIIVIHIPKYYGVHLK
jgi:hypothetical protein